MRLKDLKAKYPEALLSIKNIEMIIDHINESETVGEYEVGIILDMIYRAELVGYVKNVSLFVMDVMTVLEEEIIHEELKLSSLGLNKIPTGAIQ